MPPAERSVVAVVRGDGPGARAVRGQERPPERIVEHAGDWASAVQAAGGEEAWLWLVDGGTRAVPGALAAMLGAARDARRPPALLAGRVVGLDGRLDPASAPWPPLHDREGAMAAAVRRLALVRMARWGSLLVDRGAIERAGSPRGDLPGAADLEWTARLLRDADGLLVPAAVSVRETGDGDGAGRARQAVGLTRALVTSDAWDRQERLWLVYASLLEGSRPSPSRSARQSVRRLSGLARFARR